MSRTKHHRHQRRRKPTPHGNRISYYYWEPWEGSNSTDDRRLYDIRYTREAYSQAARLVQKAGGTLHYADDDGVRFSVVAGFRSRKLLHKLRALLGPPKPKQVEE